MASKRLDREDLRRILVFGWMTHDGLWFDEVATKFGMGEASPMNHRVCRKLGMSELSRFIKVTGAVLPRTMSEYRELFEFAAEAFVPHYQKWHVDYPGEDVQVFHMFECFAHKALKDAGRLPDYECGIFERIEGWFDAMQLKYERTPDLSRCLKLKGNDCVITVKFSFD